MLGGEVGRRRAIVFARIAVFLGKATILRKAASLIQPTSVNNQNVMHPTVFVRSPTHIKRDTTSVNQGGALARVSIRRESFFWILNQCAKICCNS